MFERLRLWYWKWFRPSKYWRHMAEGLVAGYRAGVEDAEREAGT